MIAERGQSLVEFAVGSSAMLLSLLGMITLSGYQEVQRRSLGAARQLSLESDWRRSGTALDVLSQRAFAHHLDDSGLLDAVGRSRIVDSESVQSSIRTGPAPGLAGEAVTVLLAPLRSSRALVGGEIDLESGGYASGDIAIRLTGRPWLPDPFREIDLTLRQPFSVLTDAWNSASPAHVRGRTASLVPTQRLIAISSTWQALAAPLSVVEPSIDDLCLGLIEPDVVPEDRLGSPVGRVSASRLCR